VYLIAYVKFFESEFMIAVVVYVSKSVFLIYFPDYVYPIACIELCVCLCLCVYVIVCDKLFYSNCIFPIDCV